MGFYRTVIFPRLMNALMKSGSEDQYRTPTLEEVSGGILEIGFGTGLNLPHYPAHIRSITALDANPGMSAVAQWQMQQSGIRVDHRVGDAEHLPFENASFDSVVCTWTLCSIRDPERALREIHRVLRPGGRFFFIEHGLSPEPEVQKWQNRLTPLNRRIADGCHLNRSIRLLIEGQNWRIERLQEFYAAKSPKSFGYMTQGIAAK